MAKAEYRSALRSRKLINSALADLLQEKPLEKITVTDVVNRAGINRGTFYAHYRDIPDVIDHLIQQTFSHIRDAITREPMQVADIACTLLSEVQKILESDLELYQKIMSSSAAVIMQEQLVSVMVDYFLAHEELFGFFSPEQYVLSVRFCAGGLGALYRDWFLGKQPCSLDELTQIAQTMVRKIVA